MDLVMPGDERAPLHEPEGEPEGELEVDKPLPEGRPEAGSKLPPAALFWARLLACGTAVVEGYGLGCLSGAHMLMQGELNLSEKEVASILEAVQMPMALGAFFGGTLADHGKLGRVPALCIGYLAIMNGAGLMAFANSWVPVFLGRILASVGSGICMCVAPVYMAEVAPTSQRGYLASLHEVFLLMGVYAGYALNLAFIRESSGWRWILGLWALLPLLLLGVCRSGLVVESPRYLLLHGRREKAIEALRIFTGEAEARATVACQRAWTAQSPGQSTSWVQLLFATDSPGRRAILIACAVMIAPMLCGIQVCSLYASALLSEEMSESWACICMLLVGVVRLFGVSRGISAIDVAGRRFMLLASSAGAILGLQCLAFSLSSFSVMQPPWGHFLGLLVVFLAYSVGLGAVPWAYCGEVLRTDLRAKGFALALILAWMCSAAIEAVFTWAVDAAENGAGMFFGLLAAATMGTFYLVLYIVPETKGCVLEGIEAHLKDHPKVVASATSGKTTT